MSMRTGSLRLLRSTLAALFWLVAIALAAALLWAAFGPGLGYRTTYISGAVEREESRSSLAEATAPEASALGHRGRGSCRAGGACHDGVRPRMHHVGGGGRGWPRDASLAGAVG